MPAKKRTTRHDYHAQHKAAPKVEKPEPSTQSVMNDFHIAINRRKIFAMCKKLAGLKTADIARDIGVSTTAVEHVLSGRKRSAKIEKALKTFVLKWSLIGKF